jgi:hypothetical protein
MGDSHGRTDNTQCVMIMDDHDEWYNEWMVVSRIKRMKTHNEKREKKRNQQQQNKKK